MLQDYEVNRRRLAAGQKPAASIWLWGQGRPPQLPTLEERFGLSGAVISAVDLIRGIGKYAGLTPILVPGATGYLDTNYAGKVAAALTALKEVDLVFLHVEAPDEAGHSGELELKMRAIEDFDAQVVGPLLAGLKALGDHRVLALCDHSTRFPCVPTVRSRCLSCSTTPDVRETGCSSTPKPTPGKPACCWTRLRTCCHGYWSDCEAWIGRRAIIFGGIPEKKFAGPLEISNLMV